MGRIKQTYTRKVTRKRSSLFSLFKKKNTSTRKRGNQKRCSKCGRFM